MSADLLSTIDQYEIDEAAAKRDLENSWRAPGGFIGWFQEVNHKAIGLRYIVTAFIFLIAGGIEALLMRYQLAIPDHRFLNPNLYNEIFTIHGSTMMFLFAVPVMEGMGIYLVPLMIGTRNVAFPRLNAYGYYMFLFGGIFLYAGIFLNMAPDAGWFAYTPLSGPQFSPGKRLDFWAQMITFTELSALVVAIEIIVTVIKLRGPGMSLDRIPIFVWAMLVQSFMVVFAMPAVMDASGMLMMDRTIGTHFFNPAEGGDPLLWQHTFWFFGHPEVYIIFIPGTGMVAELVTVFSRRPIFGYTAIVLSIISTGFIGFGLWVHHMFATGLPQLGESFFTAASLLITIPTGVQFFCWLATMWGGRPKLTVPFWYVISFFIIFVAGGLSGVMIASVPFDIQVHDTFFIVAHFHYVLIGGAVFPLLGAIYYWFPKMTGRLQDDRLGLITCWILLIGFNLTFFPMHWLGLHGMPRRVYTYSANSGWASMNALASIGAVVIAVGGILYLVNIFRSKRDGGFSGPNPWQAGTLEWMTDSPAPRYNFLHIPIVSGREPLWERPSDEIPLVIGLRTDRREALVTRTLEASPDHRYVLPGPTIWPFWVAVGTGIGFTGSVFNMWWFVLGGFICFVPFVGWFWPHRNINFVPKMEKPK